jgi:Zn-dependent protease with chaperone function
MYSTDLSLEHRKAFQLNRAIAWRVTLVLFLAAAPAIAQSAGPQFPDPGKAPMSRDEQKALGMQAASEVYKQMPVLPDSSPETKYIRHLGEKLVATIPAQYSWPFEFHVVQQKEINAFALPGGQMFVNVGTITAAKNEAELAGVMAHEMSHVYMQHSAKQAGKAQTTNMISQIAGIALGTAVGGTVGQLGQMGIQMGAQGLMLKYSRGDESQADAVGAMILYKAGYNPQSLADFFKTLQTEGGQSPPQWLSDHPNPGNREEAIQKEIANWPAVKYTGDTPEFAAIRKSAEGVKAYSGEEIAQGAKSGQWTSLNQKSGAKLSGSSTGTGTGTSAGGGASAAKVSAAVPFDKVAPSKTMVVSDLGPIKMQRPDNWAVTLPQQQGQFVTIAPQAGVTEAGVGYGVLVNGLAAQQIQGMNIDDVTSKLAQKLAADAGLQTAGSPQKTTAGGVEGRSVVLKSTSPFPGAKGEQQSERDWLVTVPQRDGSVIFMIFITPETQVAQFKPTFDAMLKSLQFRQ